MLTFRDATTLDLDSFYHRTRPMTVRAIVAEREGAVVGIGGYYISGDVAIAFTDGTSMSKREVIACGREMIRLLKTLHVNVIAQCGSHGDTALRHFGFTSKGCVYLFGDT